MADHDCDDGINQWTGALTAPAVLAARERGDAEAMRRALLELSAGVDCDDTPPEVRLSPGTGLLLLALTQFFGPHPDCDDEPDSRLCEHHAHVCRNCGRGLAHDEPCPLPSEDLDSGSEP